MIPHTFARFINCECLQTRRQNLAALQCLNGDIWCVGPMNRTGGHDGAHSSMVKCPEYPQGIPEPNPPHTAVPHDLSHPDVK